MLGAAQREPVDERPDRADLAEAETREDRARLAAGVGDGARRPAARRRPPSARGRARERARGSGRAPRRAPRRESESAARPSMPDDRPPRTRSRTGRSRSARGPAAAAHACSGSRRARAPSPSEVPRVPVDALQMLDAIDIRTRLRELDRLPLRAPAVDVALAGVVGS